MLSQAQEIPLEPKMADVLDYLLLHQERYVPLAELHSQVWAGRVVTDTAVRRVISRLRALLEPDSAVPTVLLSLPKRGYRLRTQAANRLEQAVPPKEIATELLAVAGGVAKQPSSMDLSDTWTPPPPTKTSARLSASLASIFSLLLAVITVGAWLISSWSDERANVVAEFVALPQDSRVIAVSADGLWVLYQLQQGAARQFDLYIHDVAKQHSVLLKQQNQFVSYGSFVTGAASLLLTFNDFANKTAWIELWQLDARQQLVANRVLIDNLAAAIYPVPLPDGQSALVSVANQSQPHQLMYQRLSWSMAEKAQLAALFQPNTYERIDSVGALSPDGKLFAFQRGTRPQADNEIQIMNQADHSLSRRLPYPQLIRDSLWLNNDVLLVLDEYRLQAYQLSSGHWIELLSNTQGNIQQLAKQGKQILLITRTPTESRFVEFDPLASNPSFQLIPREADVVRLLHSVIGREQWYSVLRKEDNYQLQWSSGETRRSLIQTQAEIRLLDQAQSGELLLLVGTRLALFTPAHSELRYLTAEQSITESAVFTDEGRQVLYTQRILQQCALYKMALSTGIQQPQNQEVCALQKIPAGYVLMDQQGRLYQADTLLAHRQSLHVNLSPEPGVYWQAIFPHLYWVSAQAGGLTLNQFDFDSHQTKLIPVSATITNLSFSLRPDGHSILLRSTHSARSTIRLLPSEITAKF